MTHLGLFEGIGGFSLAAKWIGWETLAWCEWNEFGQKVLRHHFPDAEGHGDITKTDFKKYAGRIDILTGGFPCQPYSTAGKRLGKEDSRHLWPEMLRCIREVAPNWVVGENVRGLTNWNGGLVFDEVQADLEAEGYEVLPFLLPACAVNAPHRRDRIWFIANSNGSKSANDGRANDEEKGKVRGDDKGDVFRELHGLGNVTDTNSHQRLERRVYEAEPDEAERHTGSCDARSNRRPDWQNFPTQSPVCSGDDGLPRELDGITFPKWRNESIKAYGNAIVPQVAFEIFKAIKEYQLNNYNHANGN
jgi:DNA (cytosine-5)-methyltransferase 1